jgi:hypothetical protein
MLRLSPWVRALDGILRVARTVADLKVPKVWRLRTGQSITGVWTSTVEVSATVRVRE